MSATEDPRRSVTLHEKDVEHVVQWLGWYMGEGNIPDSPGELSTMRKLVEALKPGERLTQLNEHISYALQCGVR